MTFYDVAWILVVLSEYFMGHVALVQRKINVGGTYLIRQTDDLMIPAGRRTNLTRNRWKMLDNVFAGS